MKENYQNLDLTEYEGVEVDLNLQHRNDTETDQYVSFKLDDITFSGWMGRVIGEPRGTVKRTIKEMFLVQHKNGGRRYGWKAKKYIEYFNEEVKQAVIAKRSAGIFGAIGMGDVDQADIMVYFTDGSVLDTMQWIGCPKSWYSEQYTEKIAKYLQWGFHETVEEALVAQKSTDDTFGERFSPVVAFPADTPQLKIDDCIWRPKVTSSPILASNYLVYGTRCKLHELGEFIGMVYKNGGKVIKNAEWDW